MQALVRVNALSAGETWAARAIPSRARGRKNVEGGSKGWINPLLPVLLQIASRLGRSVWPFVWPGRTSVAKEAAEVDFRVRRRNASKAKFARQWDHMWMLPRQLRLMQMEQEHCPLKRSTCYTAATRCFGVRIQQRLRQMLGC